MSDQFLAIGAVFDRATLGITPPYTRLDLFSPIMTVSDGATLGVTPSPLGLTPPVPGIEQLYGCQTHSAARYMLGTLGFTSPVPGIEQFWSFRHTRQRVIRWGR